MAFPGGGPPKAEINITPLIDVLLVLIIVFMVVVSMSQDKGLEAQIPQPAQKGKLLPPERTIVIRIEAGLLEQQTIPILKINEESVSWGGLRPRLQEIFTPRLERVAFVQGDKQIDFEPVAQVIDIAHAAGVDHVGLITSQPKQEARVQ